MDLHLASIEELSEEIQKRSEYYILCSGMRGKEDVYYTNWYGDHLKLLGLCSKIQREINDCDDAELNRERLE